MGSSLSSLQTKERLSLPLPAPTEKLVPRTLPRIKKGIAPQLGVFLSTVYTLRMWLFTTWSQEACRFMITQH